MLPVKGMKQYLIHNKYSLIITVYDVGEKDSKG